LRLAQRVGSFLHRYGVFPEADRFGAAGKRRLDRTAYCRKCARDRSPHRFHRHDRGRKCRWIEASRERRATLGQNTLDQSREPMDQRQHDRHADDIVRCVIQGQQRHAITGARSPQQQRDDDGKKHQRDQGGDQLEKDIGDGQPLGGGAGANRSQGGTRGCADVLTDDQRTGLVKSNRSGMVCGQRDGDCRGR